MLATEWNVSLNAVHVLDPGAKPLGDTSPLVAALRATMTDGNADVNVVLPIGRAPETIVSTADATGSGIIVTGVARHNHLTDYFIGTAVDYVVQMSKVPVLVVKQRPHGPYRIMLVATDLSDCSRAALLKAAEMFPTIPIHLVHAWRVPFAAWLDSHLMREEVERDARRGLEAFLDHPLITPDVRQRTTARLDFGETEPVVARALRESGADLVVLGTHGQSAGGYATIGSTAESLLSWIGADTLMIRE